MEKDMLYYVRISGQVMRNNLEARKELTAGLRSKYRHSGKKDICVIASGSSLNAVLAAQNLLDRYICGRVMIFSPTDYLDYHRDKTDGCFVIVISQSGCSTNIIRAVKVMKEEQIPNVALTGTPGGDLKDHADCLIEYGVGNETIDYVTLGYSVLIEFLIMFAIESGVENGTIQNEEYAGLIRELETCCKANTEMYRLSEIFTQNFYQSLLQMERAIIVADGANMGTAREAALKFQETLKIPAVYYEGEEYIHGPNMQLTPDHTVFFIDTNPKHGRLHEIFEATKIITPHTYMVTNKKINSGPAILCTENSVRNALTPLFTAVPFQYIAAQVTKEKNNFKCHPLFKKFEEKIRCKTADYDEIMKNKRQQPAAGSFLTDETMYKRGEVQKDA